MSGDLDETIAQVELLLAGLLAALTASPSEIHRGIGDAARWSQHLLLIGADPDNPARIRTALLPGYTSPPLCPAVVARALHQAAADLDAQIVAAGVSCGHQHDGSSS